MIKPFQFGKAFCLYLCYMNESLDPTNENFSPEELDVEKKLRPLAFDDFTGQDQVLENLQIFVQAANLRTEALDHTLFHGPPGLGKTTLAHILANELEVGIKVTSGPVLDKPGDLAGLLTNLDERDVLFIDEIHTLVGAGKNQGALDAANILKPALARGVEAIERNRCGRCRLYRARPALRSLF